MSKLDLLLKLDKIKPLYVSEFNNYKEYYLSCDTVVNARYIKEWIDGHYGEDIEKFKDYIFYAKVYNNGDCLISAHEGDFINVMYADLEYVIDLILNDNKAA